MQNETYLQNTERHDVGRAICFDRCQLLPYECAVSNAEGRFGLARLELLALGTCL